MGHRRTFDAVLETGHKGAAVIVPFDPEKAWKRPAVPVASPQYGSRPGHLVRGTMNGAPFEGWIGSRWGRFFVLVDEDLRRAAGAEVGGTVRVVLEPRPPAKSSTRRRTPRARRT